MQILENLLGGDGGNGNSIFGEAREAFVAGCWGTIMSAGFLFLFFFTFLALLFQVEMPVIQQNLPGLTFPIICIVGISALLSPFAGALMGANSGVYRMTQHLGCFVLYIVALLGAIVGITLYF